MGNFLGAMALAFPYLLGGAWLTVQISSVAAVLAIVLGLCGALGRLSRFVALRLLGGLYIEVFRGTPILVQLYIMFFVVGGALQNAGLTIDSYYLGVATLAINYGAYLSEVFRAGIQSIDSGQAEAARSLGLRESLVLRRIILPQAVLIVIPPLANNVITLVQDSSYLSALSLVELTNASQGLASGQSLQERWPVYILTTLLYFVLCYPIALLARGAERRFRAAL
jgi:polar amino acid transport system permease protein